MTEPTYRFKGRSIDADPSGYYYPRWDKARKLSVLARTKDEATEKALIMLGTPPQHRAWSLIWDSVDEEMQTTPAATE